MNREEALKFLLGEWNAATTPEAKKAFVDDVTKLAHPIQNHFYSLGFGAGKLEGGNDRSGEIATLTGAKTEAERKLTEATQRIATLEQSKPDIAEITRNHANEIQKLNDAHKVEVDGLKKTNEDTLVDVAVERYKSHLATVGLDERAQQGEAALIRSRIKIINGKATLLQEGSTSTPLAVADGQDAYKVEAERIATLINPARITATGDKGGGDRRDNSGNNGGGNKTKYDRIREEEEQRNKSTASPGDIFNPIGSVPASNTSR
jgi:hypothetical protein